MRFFLEVAYDGLFFSGFQIQDNSKTIQGEIERALEVIFKHPILLTGSSRTDAGVNAYQNFFHFDYDKAIEERVIYNLNAILPPAIAIIQILPVKETAHARFSANSRTYEYVVIKYKSPFQYQKAYYFPNLLDIDKLNEFAMEIINQINFKQFSKTNTQVNNFNCSIYESYWRIEKEKWIYTVKANRFLRGMVKALVGTALKFNTNKIQLSQVKDLFLGNAQKGVVDFSPPGHGLFLKKVEYPKNIFEL